MREVIRPFNARMQSSLKPAIRNLYADGHTALPSSTREAWPMTASIMSTLTPGFSTCEMAIRAPAFFDAIEFNDLWTHVTSKQVREN